MLFNGVTKSALSLEIGRLDRGDLPSFFSAELQFYSCPPWGE